MVALVLTHLSVEPTIWIGICAVAPAVAVIVAVRFAKLPVPDLKVKVAEPVLSVVTVDALNRPVSADNVTTAPGTTLFVALTAVTVMVVLFELSELTDVGEADSCSVAAVVVVVVVVVVVLVLLGGLPQPARIASISAPAHARGNFNIVRLKLCIRFPFCPVHYKLEFFRLRQL